MILSKDKLKNYQNFVDQVTSKYSKNSEHLIERLKYVDDNNIEVSRILTAGVGLSGEVGEFNEILKKIIFQEKPITDTTITHLKKELGDIMWYIAQASIALDTDIEELIDINEKKLRSRFHGDTFDPKKSELKKPEDL